MFYSNEIRAANLFDRQDRSKEQEKKLAQQLLKFAAPLIAKYGTISRKRKDDDPPPSSKARKLPK